MPELPEVETVRRALAPCVVGRMVERVTIRRRDVVHGCCEGRSLLEGCRITGIERLGKQLAIIGQTCDGVSAVAGPVVCVHLGMTGSLRFRKSAAITDDFPRQAGGYMPSHIHIIWGFPHGTLIFRDPRRFGGMWTFPSMDALHDERWSALGEDALAITPGRLLKKLRLTHRSLKAALLDQAVVAGLGNIYVDELLFAARLHPGRAACEVDLSDVRRMVRQMRGLLNRAIEAGGSSIRDYVSADGRRGGFQNVHRVYGRAGLACMRCGMILQSTTIAGRTTVFCLRCQLAS